MSEWSKCICTKESDIGFHINEIYLCYKYKKGLQSDRKYFFMIFSKPVLMKRIDFDEESFNEHFIDIYDMKKIRKYKLENLNETINLS